MVAPERGANTVDVELMQTESRTSRLTSNPLSLQPVSAEKTLGKQVGSCCVIRMFRALDPSGHSNASNLTDSLFVGTCITEMKIDGK